VPEREKEGWGENGRTPPRNRAVRRLGVVKRGQSVMDKISLSPNAKRGPIRDKRRGNRSEMSERNRTGREKP